MLKFNKFPSKKDKEAIVRAIRKAEENTSGEIRVYIEKATTRETHFKKASNLFLKLEMDKTALRNGVLIYIAVNDRRFVILGDEGINKVVAEDFWDQTKDVMEKHFKQGEFKTGIIEGVLQAGKELKTHFPHQENDENELSNKISNSL